MILSSNAHRRAATSAKSLTSSFSSSFLSSTTQWLPERPLVASITHDPPSRRPQSCLRSPYRRAPLTHDVSLASNLNIKAVTKRSHTICPRTFMLRCRHDRALQRTYPQLLSRDYSLATRPAVSDPISPQEEHVNNRPLQTSQSARIIESSDGERNLELIMHETSQPASSKASSTDSDQMPSYRVLRIDGNIEPQGTQSKSSWRIRLPESNSTVSWDDILHTLAGLTPAQAPQQFYLSLQGAEEHILELYCRLVHNPSYSISLERPIVHFGRARLFMKGDYRSLSLVKGYIHNRRLSDKISGSIEEEGPSSYWIRKQQEGNRRVRLASPARSPDDVPEPKRWTARSLADYIQTLTSIRPPPALRTDAPFKERVEAIIFEVLRDDRIRRYLTFGVFHDVLTYLLHQRKVSTAWALMSMMEELDFAPTTLHYNVMLSASAQDLSPKAFNNVIETMTKRRMVPNTGTWVALLTAPTSTEFKQNVMRRMFDKGLSAHSAFERESAALIIPYSLRPFLDTGGSVNEYLAILDDIWGPTWMTDDAVCQILDVVAASGSVAEAVHLVDHLADVRGFNYNKMSKAPLHILLKHCLQPHAADLAVWLIVYSAEKWKSPSVDHITLSTMFTIVWGTRLYNLLRVVWVFATAEGQLDFNMRSRILSSLEARANPMDESVRGDWRSSAGVVACNADPLTLGQTPRQILDKQSTRFEKVKPWKSFAHMLVQALFKDKEWAEKGIRKTTGTTWKRLNAINVSVRPHYVNRRSIGKMGKADKKKEAYRPQRRVGRQAIVRK